MKHKTSLLFGILILLATLSCQLVTDVGSEPTPSPTPAAAVEPSPIPATPTLISTTEKSLAGLIISSQALSSLQTDYIRSRGLGIINEVGELIRIADLAWYDSYSPEGDVIVYQHGYSEDLAVTAYNLKAYHVATGKTVELDDNLDGYKDILMWLDFDPAQFIYSNDLESLLFEAYGYFDGQEILVANSHTGETSLLLENVQQFDLSPDSTEIAYTLGEITKDNYACFQPYLYDINLSSSSLLDTGNLDIEPICMGYPKWSPNGKHIAWMGYMGNQEFRPVIFNLEDGTGKIFDAVDGQVQGTWIADWSIPRTGWVDENIYWATEYEIDIRTGDTFSPREDPLPDEYFEITYDLVVRPDGLLSAELNDDGLITLSDSNGNTLASYSLYELYSDDVDFGLKM